MDKLTEEWLKQSSYDLDTAEAMCKSSRFLYAVFMSHLCVEKALKGAWQSRLKTPPSKTHNLRYLANQTGLQLPADLGAYVDKLDAVSVPTRYPADLDKAIAAYPEARAREIVEHAGKVFQWIKTQL